ncbi:hypothetical protein IAU59_004444 [Kwoniella sp. CBS 9459]
MLETVVGQIPARKLEYSYSNTPFIDTVKFSNNSGNNRHYNNNITGAGAGVGTGRASYESSTQRHIFSRQSQRSNEKDSYKDREDLASESENEFLSAGEEDLDMGELSDSPSSVHTSSRPVTPSNPLPHTAAIHIPRASGSPSRHSPSAGGTGGGEGVFTLAHKAEKILGLVPGTLGHAKACLENARDEVRRTAEIKSPTPEPLLPGYSFSGSGHGHDQNHTSSENGNGVAPGMRDRIHTRARKAMSVAGFPGYSASHSHSSSYGSSASKMNGMVVGIGGKEEEERRERRRKAADGVLYWQREVAKLEKEAEAAMAGNRR